MIGWHLSLNAHEFDQTLGDSEVSCRSCGLVCCSPWGKIPHTMGQLTLVPQLLSLCTLERMRSSCLPQLGKAHMEQQRTSAAKNNEINKLKPLSSSSKSVLFSLSVVSDSATPWAAAFQASLSITSSQSLLNQTQVH